MYLLGRLQPSQPSASKYIGEKPSGKLPRVHGIHRLLTKRSRSLPSHTSCASRTFLSNLPNLSRELATSHNPFAVDAVICNTRLRPTRYLGRDYYYNFFTAPKTCRCESRDMQTRWASMTRQGHHTHIIRKTSTPIGRSESKYSCP